MPSLRSRSSPRQTRSSRPARASRRYGTHTTPDHLRIRAQVIVAYIDAHRDRFGVEPICTVLSEHGVSIAPSTYYARRITPVSPAELEEAYLVNALLDLHQANWGVYGVRKLWRAARRAGHEVGRDQVGRLMGIARISGAVRD